MSRTDGSVGCFSSKGIEGLDSVNFKPSYETDADMNLSGKRFSESQGDKFPNLHSAFRVSNLAVWENDNLCGKRKNQQNVTCGVLSPIQTENQPVKILKKQVECKASDFICEAFRPILGQIERDENTHPNLTTTITPIKNSTYHHNRKPFNEVSARSRTPSAGFEESKNTNPEVTPFTLPQLNF